MDPVSLLPLPRVQPIMNEMLSFSRSTRNCGVTNATFHIMLHALAMRWTSGFDDGSGREFALHEALDGEWKANLGLVNLVGRIQLKSSNTDMKYVSSCLPSCIFLSLTSGCSFQLLDTSSLSSDVGLDSFADLENRLRTVRTKP